MSGVADISVDAIIEPDTPIIDAHHHVWNAAHGKYDYLAPELTADLASGHNIRQTIYCECKSMFKTYGPPGLRPVGETEFVLARAAEYHGPTAVFAGMVMFADLRLGAGVEEVLGAHAAIAGTRMKGIRNIAAYDPSPLIRSFVQGPDLLADRAFREGVACLARHGMIFETYVFHPQLPELAALAAEQPDACVVLNAFGGPLGIGPYKDRRHEVFTTWRSDMAALARRPNVYVHIAGFGAKMLGFGFHKHAELPSNEAFAREWWPYVEVCLETFGPSRCMFASNFPEDRSSISYRQIWNVYKHVCGRLSVDEKRMLFSDTSKAVYKLHA